MEVLYHGIKTHDFPLCFPHELLMSLRRLYTSMFENSVTNVRGAETSKFWPNPQFGDFRSKHSFSTHSISSLDIRYSLL